MDFDDGGAAGGVTQHQATIDGCENWKVENDTPRVDGVKMAGGDVIGVGKQDLQPVDVETWETGLHPAW